MGVVHRCIDQCFSLADEKLNFIQQAAMQLHFIALTLSLELRIKVHLERPL